MDIPLSVQLDRKEEVDLVVSVFDESLLGVSGDLSKNIRDFYLADARGQGRAARELAATRFGNITVAELVKKAEELLKDKNRLAKEPGLEDQLQGLSERWKKGRIEFADVISLVRLSGLEVYLSSWVQFGELPLVSGSFRNPRHWVTCFDGNEGNGRTRKSDSSFPQP